MATERKTQQRVAKPRVNRVMTPELTEHQRTAIRQYHKKCREEGMMISEGAALLYAAMQTINAVVAQ